MISAPISAGADLVADSAGIHSGLGSFWEGAFQDNDLIKGLVTSSDALSAQLFQRYAETAASTSHATVPTFARFRWRFVTLRETDRNAGRRLAARVSNASPVMLGTQTAAPYAPGLAPKVGGHLALAGRVGYPFEHTQSIQVAIVDRIADPRRVLIPGVDFIIEEGTILFSEASDPFTLGFPVRTVMDDNQEYREVALWCRDAYVDTDLPNRLAGYALAVNEPASEWYSRYINALWTLAQSGGSDAALAAYVYTALDVPYTTAEEQVEYVGELEDSAGVITDQTVYPLARLTDTALEAGDVIPAYTPITDIVRVSSGSEWGGTGNVVLPLSNNVARGVVGLSAGMAPADITYEGLDSAGNPKLRFLLHGDSASVAKFWLGVDAFCESAGVSQVTMLEPHLYDYRPETRGAVWGTLSPASFFIDYYYGNSAKCISVDMDRLGANGRTGLYRLSDADVYLPPGVRLTINMVGSSADTYELEATSDALSAALSVVADTVGAASDRVSASWVPVCKGGEI